MKDPQNKEDSTSLPIEQDGLTKRQWICFEEKILSANPNTITMNLIELFFLRWQRGIQIIDHDDLI